MLWRAWCLSGRLEASTGVWKSSMNFLYDTWKPGFWVRTSNRLECWPTFILFNGSTSLKIIQKSKSIYTLRSRQYGGQKGLGPLKTPLEIADYVFCTQKITCRTIRISGTLMVKFSILWYLWLQKKEGQLVFPPPLLLLLFDPGSDIRGGYKSGSGIRDKHLGSAHWYSQTCLGFVVVHDAADEWWDECDLCLGTRHSLPVN
jgi:hypothetical protein